jgi:uncharacterized protein YkwD
MSGWLNSSGHRQNMLANFRDYGIGVLRGTLTGSSGQVWVTHFGYRC